MTDPVNERIRPASHPSGGLRVQVNYFAAARSACGTTTEEFRLPEPTVARVLDEVVHSHGEPAARVLARCSFLLDGRAVHNRTTALPDGAVLDVLPPFAGG